MRKILFVDRDGTLVVEPEDCQIDRIEKIRLLPGVIPALLSLREAGFEFVMVTNQDGLGTSAFPRGDFERAHSFILDLFASQGVFFSDVLICPHLPFEGCSCRKPHTGLLTRYLKDPSIAWDFCAMVGDRETDMQLASALCIKSFLISPLNRDNGWTQISEDLLSTPRRTVYERKTGETSVKVSINLDGAGVYAIHSGIGFFDHMLEQLSKHSLIDLRVDVKGDLKVDSHHTIEDTAICVGRALRQALSDKVGIERYGFVLPMDECRAEALIDLSGRPYACIKVPFSTDRIGDVPTEMIEHFLETFAMSASLTLHLTVSEGNNHHMAEAAFKSLGRALRNAVNRPGKVGLPTTKGTL